MARNTTDPFSYGFFRLGKIADGLYRHVSGKVIYLTYTEEEGWAIAPAQVTPRAAPKPTEETVFDNESNGTRYTAFLKEVKTFPPAARDLFEANLKELIKAA